MYLATCGSVTIVLVFVECSANCNAGREKLPQRLGWYKWESAENPVIALQLQLVVGHRNLHRSNIRNALSFPLSGWTVGCVGICRVEPLCVWSHYPRWAGWGLGWCVSVWPCCWQTTSWRTRASCSVWPSTPPRTPWTTSTLWPLAMDLSGDQGEVSTSTATYTGFLQVREKIRSPAAAALSSWSWLRLVIISFLQ